jgi:hypothetical protein
MPANILLTYEPKIGLMNEGCRLQGVVLPFPAHVSSGEPVQLAIHEGKEFGERCLVPVAPILKELGNFAWGRHNKTLRGYLARRISQEELLREEPFSLKPSDFLGGVSLPITLTLKVN